MCVGLFCRHQRVAKITHQGWSTSCAQSALQSAQTGLLLFLLKFLKEGGQVYSQRQCQTIRPALLTVSDVKLLHLRNKLHCFLFSFHSVSCSQFTVHSVWCSRDFYVATFQSGLANQKPCNVSHGIAPAGL